MKKKVFISGSINIDVLPEKVIESLSLMKKNNLSILVGDAGGVDSAVQKYFNHNKYFDVSIYTIYDKPRHRKSTNFSVKVISVNGDISKERERQIKKDEMMTTDSDYSLVVWDGKSKGSYFNILRSIEQKKPVKVFLYYENRFLEQDKINQLEINYIFSENNGYTSSELLEQLNLLGVNSFKNTREINSYLTDSNLIYKDKEKNIYLPVKDNENFFKVKLYKGKNTGVLFTNQFVDWLYNKINKELSSEEQVRFNF